MGHIVLMELHDNVRCPMMMTDYAQSFVLYCNEYWWSCMAYNMNTRISLVVIEASMWLGILSYDDD